MFYRVDLEKPSLNLNEDEKLKEMIYIMYNYVSQKESLEKAQNESDTSSCERSPKNLNSSSESHLSSPSMVSPRSNYSENSMVSPYGLLQMVNILVSKEGKNLQFILLGSNANHSSSFLFAKTSKAFLDSR
jgi:hypothetical protein